ncbi:MAG TPA: amino acid ABC transporter permease [Ktedonobacteraceae bacterium]|jgi:His/Glu/Gln/Arg/opine family amino acid ABC transporter permease subunit|nr:amino acid ABC transporter permease [Ktedonobacteraceae bacterium]
MQQTISSTQPEVRSFRTTILPIINVLFYVVLAVSILAFIYYLYTHLDLINTYLVYLLEAAALTLGLSVVSMVLAVLFGFLGALGRRSRFAPIRYIALVYVEVVRGTPILVQLLLWYFGVGQALSALGFDPYTAAFNFMTLIGENSLVPLAFSAYFYGIIGLSFNYGAYLTEVFRAGLESVDKGQTEAALSLGLNSWQTLRHIVLPQAIRITIPPFTNYFITLIQDSALLSVLGVVELENTMGSFADPLIDPGQKLFLYIFGALFYFAMCYPLSLLARFFEARFARAY